jgi:signal transduction histidine kinase
MLEGGKCRPETISRSEFVKDTLPLIQREIDPAIRVETNLASNIPHIEADIAQMRMVLSALLTNAAEAIEGTGRITIATKNENVDEDFARYRPGLRPARYASLTVQYDGKGMDEEPKSRLFEPFFTRKSRVVGLAWLQCMALSRTTKGGFQ